MTKCRGKLWMQHLKKALYLAYLMCQMEDIIASEKSYIRTTLVYPNGKFVFKDGSLVAPVAMNIGNDNKQDEILLWQINSVKCKYNSENPFTPKKRNQ
jgi:hypothetical protein